MEKETLNALLNIIQAYQYLYAGATAFRMTSKDVESIKKLEDALSIIHEVIK